MWLIFLILFFSTNPIFAQVSETPSPIPTPTIDEFTQFKNDYTYQYNQYLNSYKKYLEKKNIYLKYGTVATQADKLAAAKTAINDRNTALKSYVQALRIRLNLHQDQDPSNTNRLQVELQNWENWFNEQLTVVPNINNTADLSKWVEDFKTRYVDIQNSIYSALVYNQINHQKYILILLDSLSNSIKSDPTIKPENQSWLSNLTIKTDLASQSLQSAANLTVKKEYQSRFNNYYPEAKNNLNTSLGYLQGILKDLKVIIIKSDNSNGN